jgi:AAHS family 4-hydroxybenzoate transporter-like MFS transporter
MNDRGSLDVESIIDSSPVCRFQVTVIVLCALIALLDGFDTQSIAFVAPEIIQAWRVDAGAFGPVFGAGLLGGMIGAMIFGMAGDRYGRKPTLLITVLLFAAGSLATPLAHSVAQLIVARIVTGFGLGGALPSFIALSAEYAPRRHRASLVALMFCGFPLGAVVGGIASAKLIPAYGWTSVFIAGGVIPLLLLPLLLVLLPESVRFLALRGDQAGIARILGRMRSTATWNGTVSAQTSEQRVPAAALFTDGRALGTCLLWATLFLTLLLTYFLVNWIPIITRQAGFPIQSAVLAVAMLNLGAVVGSILLGRLADRFGPAGVIAVAFTCGALAIAGIGQVGGSTSLLYASTFLAGFFSIAGQMCTVALCASFYETFLRSTGIGWSMGVGRIGAIVGPVLAGVLLASGVAAPLLFIVAGCTSLGAALTVALIGTLVLPNQRRRSIPAADRAAQPM